MEKKYCAGFDVGGCNIREVIADENDVFGSNILYIFVIFYIAKQ